MSDTQTRPVQANCASCGALLAGPYCQMCGQPSHAARRTFADAVYGQTGRLARTVWLLVAKPGELAREIDEARDHASMRPGILLANLIAVFLLVAGGVFSGIGVHDMTRQDPTGRVAAVVAQRSAEQGVNEDVFAERVGSRFRSAYSVLITVGALGYAGGFWLVHRRQPKTWLVHLVVGVQVLCFAALVTAAALAAARLTTPAPIIGIAAIGALIFYIYLSSRRVYGDPAGAAIAKTIVVLAIGSLCTSVLGVLSLVIALYTA